MRKIDDIIPPSRRRDSESLTRVSTRRGASTVGGPRSWFPYRTVIAVVAVVAVSIAALFYFSSTRVEVTPNTVSAAVQNSFTATQSSGDLPYEIITSQKIASQSVQGSGTKTVSTMATGYIAVYNTQSKAQRLITNTRFATTAGLIFRVHHAITIPAGSTSKPGSIRVQVYADKPGDTYNVGPTSFTIPGLAGLPQEHEVYARSTEPMTGGASGTIPVVDPALTVKTRAALVSALTPQLAESLKAEVPEGYTLLPGAATTTYQALTPTPAATTGMVEVKEQGTITGVIFPTAALAKAIASNVQGMNYQGESLSLLASSSVRLIAADFPTPDATSFSFSLSGTADLVYTINPSSIAAAVAGKSRSAAEVALTNYPEVKSAVLVLRPFWRQTFPQDPSSITVTVNKP